MGPKKNAQKMSLGDFLGDQSLGSWADEMEDAPISYSRTGYGGERRAVSSAAAFNSDRDWNAGRGGAGGGMGMGGGRDMSGYAVREQLPLPTKPPYTAHIGNLSFDATEGDIEDLFRDCEVTNVRIAEDKMEKKPKGFGYVDFATVEGLKKALEFNGTQFQGRNIRTSVADPPKDRPETSGRDMDWSSARRGPLPPDNTQRRTSEQRGFGRNYETASDAGSDHGGRQRRAPFEGDGKVRDFSNWERRGPLSPGPNQGPPRGEGGPREGGRSRPGPPGGAAEGGFRERKMSPSWGEGRSGEGRSQEGSRPPRREFQERPAYDRQPTAPEMDNQWRARMRPDAPPAKSPTATPDISTPSSPAATPAAPAAPATRPRLNLQKRTVSEAGDAIAPGSAGDSKASPFGAARPIDTAAREKEIEEKRQLALRQKKEADDKAREEKRAKEAAAKSEKTSDIRNGPQENGKHRSKENGETKEADTETPKSKPNFEILRRMSDENGDVEEAEEDGDANGEIIDDKAVKPKEVVKDPNSATDEPTAENLEEEGWSSVPARGKKTSRGRGGARALAS